MRKVISKYTLKINFKIELKEYTALYGNACPNAKKIILQSFKCTFCVAEFFLVNQCRQRKKEF